LAALIAYWAFLSACLKLLLWAKPLHNRMDTYCAINRAEWAIPWNSGVLQFKKGPRPPPLCLERMMGRMTTDDETDGWKGRPSQADKTKDII
jgi:hypothetical protein